MGDQPHEPPVEPAVPGTPALPTPAPVADEPHRLHPFSWLFVFATQMRTAIFPLLALWLFGSGEWWELFILVGAAGVALYSLIYSFGFRYRLGRDELLVREGILQRTERHVPYARIQNIVQRRNPLHRLFGVTELRLESAGGTSAEAVMNVITLDEARRIEGVLRQSTHAPDGAAPVADDEAATLLALGPGDLVRLGLVTNRGWLLVGAMFALFWQFEPWESGSVRHLFSIAGQAFVGWRTLLPGLSLAVSVLSAVLAFLVTIKLLSIVMAFVTFYGFRLQRRGERIATEMGLLTRQAATARREKVQRLVVGESWLARRLGLRTLTCDIAAGANVANENEGQRLRWLAPVARPDDVRRVALDVAPGLDADAMQWRPLHPDAWRRMYKQYAIVWTLLAIPATINFGWQVALAAWVGMLAWSVFAARGNARFGGWACDGSTVAYRTGWFNRTWMLARVGKGQAVGLHRSPFDRRAGMAAVTLDTAGASAMANEMKVSYLAEADARELAEALRQGIDATDGTRATAPAAA
jgi:putative membrane protein